MSEHSHGPEVDGLAFSSGNVLLTESGAFSRDNEVPLTISSPPLGLVRGTLLGRTCPFWFLPDVTVSWDGAAWPAHAFPAAPSGPQVFPGVCPTPPTASRIARPFAPPHFKQVTSPERRIIKDILCLKFSKMEQNHFKTLKAERVDFQPPLAKLSSYCRDGWIRSIL